MAAFVAGTGLCVRKRGRRAIVSVIEEERVQSVGRKVFGEERREDASNVHEAKLKLIPALGSDGGPALRTARAHGLDPELVSLTDDSVDNAHWGKLVKRAWTETQGEKFVVIGESTGGTLALMMACRGRSDIERLVLVNPVTSPRPELTAVARAVPRPLRNLLPDYDSFVANRADLFDTIRFSNKDLRNIDIPVTIIVTADDKVHPSYKESERLMRLLPNATRLVIDKGGHYPMRSLKFDITNVLSTAEKLEKQWKPPRTNPESDEKSMNRKDLDYARRNMEFLRRTTSPVFVGANRLPDVLPGERPVLFVGNHTIFGFFDIPFLMDYLLTQRGILVRGLAHPLLFRRTENQQQNGDDKTKKSGPPGVEAYGAVKVSPKNLYNLMREKKWALLFPGGIREAHKRKSEEYDLMWPEEQEFIRLAARFGAYVVPFASVGPEDSFEILLDSEEQLKLPFVPGMLSRFMNDQSVSANSRKWKTAEDDDNASLIPPLARPKLPKRFYCKFGEPIDASKLNHRNKEECQGAYDEVRDTVKGLIDELRQRRREDVYDDFRARIAFEAGNGVQAPTTWSWSARGTYIPEEDL